jgi:hypothetical protein
MKRSFVVGLLVSTLAVLIVFQALLKHQQRFLDSGNAAPATELGG